MKKAILFAATLGLTGALLVPAQERPQEREKQEHARAEYHFRHDDAPKLREHYKDINRVDMHNRGHFVAGERLSGDWHKRIRPVPEAVIRELPPAPAGYAFGYIDGYCVVYDPGTGYIADVIDLSDIR